MNNEFIKSLEFRVPLHGKEGTKAFLIIKETKPTVFAIGISLSEVPGQDEILYDVSWNTMRNLYEWCRDELTQRMGWKR